jgi:hypothetical protein
MPDMTGALVLAVSAVSDQGARVLVVFSWPANSMFEDMVVG